MANQDDNRVLCRRGARELAPCETETVGAGFINTSICSVIGFNSLTQTHTGGDCDGHPGDTDTDL